MKTELLLALCAGVEDDTEVRVIMSPDYSVGIERVEIIDGEMYLFMKDDFAPIPDDVQ